MFLKKVKKEKEREREREREMGKKVGLCVWMEKMK